MKLRAEQAEHRDEAVMKRTMPELMRLGSALPRAKSERNVDVHGPHDGCCLTQS